MSEQYDLIIIGGGLVGASLCLALAHLPIRIAIIEAKVINYNSPTHSDARSIALSYGSFKIFSTMGLKQDLLLNSAPIFKIHVSDQGRFGSTVFTAKDLQVPALGYVISFDAINQLLAQHLLHCKNTELFAPSQIIDVSKSQDNIWQINIKHKDQIIALKSQLMIAADGNNSTIRQQQQFPIIEKDYPQSAILTKIRLKHAHSNTAYERFTHDGAIALLPLNDLNASIVWTMPHHKAKQMMSATDEIFLHNLQQSFGSRLGNFVEIGIRYYFPLKMIIAKQQIKSGLLLLGNAAQSLHPIAAQGFNLALKHVAFLADAINKAYNEKLEITDNYLIENYLNKIEKDRQQIINFTHYLTKIFGNNTILLNSLRDSGLTLLDLLPNTKKMFAQKCMGLSGKLPNILREMSLQTTE